MDFDPIADSYTYDDYFGLNNLWQDDPPDTPPEPDTPLPFPEEDDLILPTVVVRPGDPKEEPAEDDDDNPVLPPWPPGFPCC